MATGKPFMNQFNRLSQLMIHQYERYLPTAFDESLTLLQKMNKIIEYLNETGKLTNDIVEQWNGVMDWVLNEGLTDSVQSKIIDLLNEGVLAEIINVVLFEELNKKITNIGNVSRETVNILEAGVIDDGVQIDYTYHNTGTSLDGVTRKIWVSEGGHEVENRLIIQQLLDEGKNIYVPKGKFVIDSKELLWIKHNGFRVIGESMEESCLIGASFNTDKTMNLSDIEATNLTLQSIVDVTPPKPLFLNTNPQFNNSDYYDLYNDVSFGFIDGEYKIKSLWGAFVFGFDNTKESGNIKINRVKFKDFFSSVIVGEKTDTEPLLRPNLISVSDCVFENIVFQSVGSNNVTDIEVKKNLFKDNYFQPIDFSRGTKNGRITDNTFVNCSTLGKTEGFIRDENRVLSDNFVIENNRFLNPPSNNSVHFKESFIISNLTGDGYVRNNIFEVSNRYSTVVRLSSKFLSKHCKIEFDNNLITIKGSVNSTFLVINGIKYNSTVSVSGVDLIVANNEIRNEAQNIETVLFGNYGDFRSLVLRNNKLSSKDGLTGNTNRFYDGYYLENILVENNTINGINKSIINLVVTDYNTIDKIVIKGNSINYLPTTNLLSTRMISGVNNTGVNGLIKTLLIQSNYSNFPNLIYADKLNIDEIIIQDNELLTNSNQTDLGQSLSVFQSNSITKKLLFERNQVEQGISSLSFNPCFITSTGKIDEVVINDNQINQLETFLRVSNVNNLMTVRMKGNQVKNSGLITMMFIDNGSMLSSGYLLGNIVECNQFNASYFEIVRDNGNIINAETINESGKVV